MSPWLILFVGAIYIWIAIDLFVSGKPGLSITFAGYALANVGMWFVAK